MNSSTSALFRATRALSAKQSDPEAAPVLKQLRKRDATTRVRALKSLSQLVLSRGDRLESLEGIIGVYARLYKSLALDTKPIVRVYANDLLAVLLLGRHVGPVSSATKGKDQNQVLSTDADSVVTPSLTEEGVISQAGKKVGTLSAATKNRIVTLLAPNITSFVPALFLSCSDGFGDANLIANEIFQTCFPSEKRKCKALLACHNQLMMLYAKLLHRKEQDVVDVAQQEKRVAMALSSLSLLLSHIEDKQLALRRQHMHQQLFPDEEACKKFFQSVVQSNAYSLLPKLCLVLPDWMHERMKSLFALMLSILQDAGDAPMPGALWGALLFVIKEGKVSQITNGQIKQLVTAISHQLRHVSIPLHQSLLPLLALMGERFRVADLLRMITSLWPPGNYLVPAQARSLAEAHVECVQYMIKMYKNDEKIGSAIVDVAIRVPMMWLSDPNNMRDTHRVRRELMRVIVKLFERFSNTSISFIQNLFFKVVSSSALELLLSCQEKEEFEEIDLIFQGLIWPLSCSKRLLSPTVNHAWKKVVHFDDPKFLHFLSRPKSAFLLSSMLLQKENQLLSDMDDVDEVKEMEEASQVIGIEGRSILQWIVRYGNRLSSEDAQAVILLGCHIIFGKEEDQNLLASRFHWLACYFWHHVELFSFLLYFISQIGNVIQPLHQVQSEAFDKMVREALRVVHGERALHFIYVVLQHHEILQDKMIKGIREDLATFYLDQASMSSLQKCRLEKQASHLVYLPGCCIRILQLEASPDFLLHGYAYMVSLQTYATRKGGLSALKNNDLPCIEELILAFETALRNALSMGEEREVSEQGAALLVKRLLVEQIIPLASQNEDRVLALAHASVLPGVLSACEGHRDLVLEGFRPTLYGLLRRRRQRISLLFVSLLIRALCDAYGVAFVLGAEKPDLELLLRLRELVPTLQQKLSSTLPEFVFHSLWQEHVSVYVGKELPKENQDEKKVASQMTLKNRLKGHLYPLLSHACTLQTYTALKLLLLEMFSYFPSLALCKELVQAVQSLVVEADRSFMKLSDYYSVIVAVFEALDASSSHPKLEAWKELQDVNLLRSLFIEKCASALHDRVWMQLENALRALNAMPPDMLRVQLIQQLGALLSRKEQEEIPLLVQGHMAQCLLSSVRVQGIEASMIRESRTQLSSWCSFILDQVLTPSLSQEKSVAGKLVFGGKEKLFVYQVALQIWCWHGDLQLEEDPASISPPQIPADKKSAVTCSTSPLHLSLVSQGMSLISLFVNLHQAQATVLTSGTQETEKALIEPRFSSEAENTEKLVREASMPLAASTTRRVKAKEPMKSQTEEFELMAAEMKDSGKGKKEEEEEKRGLLVRRTGLNFRHDVDWLAKGVVQVIDMCSIGDHRPWYDGRMVMPGFQPQEGIALLIHFVRLYRNVPLGAPYEKEAQSLWLQLRASFLLACVLLPLPRHQIAEGTIQKVEAMLETELVQSLEEAKRTNTEFLQARDVEDETQYDEMKRVAHASLISLTLVFELVLRLQNKKLVGQHLDAVLGFLYSDQCVACPLSVTRQVGGFRGTRNAPTVARIAVWNTLHREDEVLIQQLCCRIYHDCCLILPVSTRNWWQSLSRVQARIVKEYTQARHSPWLLVSMFRTAQRKMLNQTDVPQPASHVKNEISTNKGSETTTQPVAQSEKGIVRSEREMDGQSSLLDDDVVVVEEVLDEEVEQLEELARGHEDAEVLLRDQTAASTQLSPVTKSESSTAVSRAAAAHAANVARATQAAAAAAEAAAAAGAFRVEVRLAVREVEARMRVDDCELSILIQMPASYPLGSCVVRCAGAGVKEVRRHHWQLRMLRVLETRDGGLVDALHIWKRQVEQLNDVDMCLICYSVFHQGALPTMECQNCNNPFHSACLMKWFSTSAKSLCPLCQVPFRPKRKS